MRDTPAFGSGLKSGTGWSWSSSADTRLRPETGQTHSLAGVCLELTSWIPARYCSVFPADAKIRRIPGIGKLSFRKAVGIQARAAKTFPGVFDRPVTMVLRSGLRKTC